MATGTPEWRAFDAGFDHGEVELRQPNVKGNVGDPDADYGGADVRAANCEGQIGDDAFNRLVAKTQTPMTFVQVLWRRLVVLGCLLPLLSLKYLATQIADAETPIHTRALLGLAALATLVPPRFLAKSLLMVKKGEVYFVQLVEDGTTQVLQAGIHLLSCLGSASQVFYVKDDVMRYGTITLLRVRPGFLGICTDNGKPVILLPGTHLYNSPSLEYQYCTSINDSVITVGPLSVVRVKPGQVGCAQLNGAPLLLEVGVHFIFDQTFLMVDGGFVDVSTPLIQNGPARIVTVPKGKIAPVVVNGEGHFLLEGRHFISQARFDVLSIQDLSTEYLSAGTRHRVLVPRGKLGLAQEAGEPILLEPGAVFLKNSELFVYRGSVDITNQAISHGSTNIVTVRDGQVGISYDDGVLRMLNPGRHMLTSATHVPAGFISTGQQTLRISEVTGLSSDNVELRFDAAVCMRVVDAQKAVVMLTQGEKNLMTALQANIQERAKLALSIIIGNNCLNKKHTATRQQPPPQGPDRKEGEEEEEDFVEVPGPAEKDDGQSFRKHIHDNFMVSFSESMVEECGVQIIDMSIEDVVITNKELATAMASAAVANSTLEKTNIDAEIVQVKAQAEAKVASIEAQGKASAMGIMTRAEASRIRATSEALAEACGEAQQLELIRASGAALGRGTTVLLAQDVGALSTLLGGAQGKELGPRLGR